MMNKKTILRLLSQIGLVCELFAKNEITDDDGEIILAWLLGCSLGKRQVSLTEKRILETMALGWQTAVDD